MVLIKIFVGCFIIYIVCMFLFFTAFASIATGLGWSLFFKIIFSAICTFILLPMGIKKVITLIKENSKNNDEEDITK